MAMGSGGNANSNPGEENVESGSVVPRVECLRKRLLAERMASRHAKEEADKLAHKVMELDNLVKKEEKSRIRAEKKLKFLINKLNSLNISGDLCLEGLSDISFLLESFKEEHMNDGKEAERFDSGTSQLLSSVDCTSTIEGTSSLSNLEQNQDENGKGSDSSGDSKSECLSQVGSNQCSRSIINQKMDEKSLKSCTEDDRDSYCQVDDPMALVPVDVGLVDDTQVVNESVKQVLDMLRQAKEILRILIARRRMNLMRRINEVK